MPRKTACIQKRAIKSKSRQYFCQSELELKKFDIFAKLELEKIKLENSNLNLRFELELELALELALDLLK